MPPRQLTKHQYSSGLSYVANTPKFLQNFGQPKPPSPPPSGSRDGTGREAIPSRPKEGKWAEGSDNEQAPEDEEEEDEWGETFGGGGDDGPQVVVLKEGRHLDGEEVKRLRRAAKGETSPPPPPIKAKQNTNQDSSNPSSRSKDRSKSIIPKSNSNTNKRKLVGNDEAEEKQQKDVKTVNDKGDEKKKKKKAKKGMLSFNEAEGED